MSADVPVIDTLSADFIRRRSIMPERREWGTAAEARHMQGTCAGAGRRPRKIDCPFCRTLRDRRHEEIR